jgi:hypothetical protein
MRFMHLVHCMAFWKHGYMHNFGLIDAMMFVCGT